jgi:hypothetical protein
MLSCSIHNEEIQMVIAENLRIPEQQEARLRNQSNIHTSAFSLRSKTLTTAKVANHLEMG